MGWWTIVPLWGVFVNFILVYVAAIYLEWLSINTDFDQYYGYDENFFTRLFSSDEETTE